MKTIEQHFIDELPADIAAMAIKNTEDSTLKRPCESAMDALMVAFVWSDTDQGALFWVQVRDNLPTGDFRDIPMPEPTDKTIDRMQRHGGSFAQQLAMLWRTADNENRKRIEVEWPELFRKYGQSGSIAKSEMKGTV